MTDQLRNLSESDRKALIAQGSEIFYKELVSTGHWQLALYANNFSPNCLVCASDAHLIERQFDKNDISAINSVAQGMLAGLKHRG